ncbi:MAG: WhiB family transcriptional regulator [Pseudonocardiales bacterium]
MSAPTPTIGSALIPPAAMKAWRALTEALVDSPPPCAADPEAWFPTDDLGVDLAAYHCGRCRAAAECGAYADAAGERAGVWGGRSRTVPRTDRSAA